MELHITFKQEHNTFGTYFYNFKYKTFNHYKACMNNNRKILENNPGENNY